MKVFNGLAKVIFAMMTIASMLMTAMQPALAIGSFQIYDVHCSDYKWYTSSGVHKDLSWVASVKSVTPVAGDDGQRYVGMPAYCLHLGVNSPTNMSVDATFDTTGYLSQMGKDAAQIEGIKWASIFGYPNYNYGLEVKNQAFYKEQTANGTLPFSRPYTYNGCPDWNSQDMALYAATQYVIWEYAMGYRYGIDTGNYKAFLSKTHLYNSAHDYASVWTAYTGLLKMIHDATTRPSFAGNGVQPGSTVQLTNEATLNDGRKIHYATLYDDYDVFYSGYRWEPSCSDSNVHLVYFKGCETIPGMDVCLEDGSFLLPRGQDSDRNYLVIYIEDSYLDTLHNNGAEIVLTQNLSQNIPTSAVIMTPNVHPNSGKQEMLIGRFDTPNAYGRFSIGTDAAQIEYAKVSIKKHEYDVNSETLIEGATYGLFTDSNCTQIAYQINGQTALFSTTKTGSNELVVSPRTYYIKELSPPENYHLSDEIYTVTLNKNDSATVDTKIVDVADKPKPKVYVKKTDSKTGAMLAGAKFMLYTDEACTEKAVTADEEYTYAMLTSTTSGSNVLMMNPGTYYIREEAADDTHLQNYEAQKIVLVEGETKEVSFKNEPTDNPGKKTSASPDFTNGNACYSLAGAQYEVRCEECGQIVGTTTTDADGNFSKLPHTHKVLDYTPDPTWENGGDWGAEGDKVGDYTLHDPVYTDKNVAYKASAVETKAAKGYALCTERHYFTVWQDGTLGFDCSEVPLNDPFSLKLTKSVADNTPGGYQNVSTAGALFQVQYFMNTDGDASGTAAKTWVFETDDDGQLFCNDEAYLVADKSDALYKDSDGGIIYPLGTYLIKEIQPPKYFQLDGSMNFAGFSDKVNVQDGLMLVMDEVNGKVVMKHGSQQIAAENLTINSFDKLYRGSVNVTKYDDDGKTPLEGVSFKLTGADGSEYNATTDENGHIEFGELLPQKYTLTETKTVEGHTLLKDNIDITIPLEMTKDEAKAQNADTNKAVWDEVGQVYCFYDVSFEVTNSSSMEVPMTGGNSMLLYVGMAIALAMIGIGVFFIIKRKLIHP